MHDFLLISVEFAKDTLEIWKSDFNNPTLVLISPLQRCIQTALYAFHPEWNKKAAEFFKRSPPRFVVMPQLQETSESTCNTCHSLAFLKERYGKEVEFPNEWFTNNDWLIKKGTQYADDNYLVAKRAEFVRQYIKGLPDRKVVVVSHGDFIQHLGNRWERGRVGFRSEFGYVDTGEVVTTVIHDLCDSQTQLQRETPPWAFFGENSATYASKCLE
jgi:broad specificity phosphatase PhoE